MRSSRLMAFALAITVVAIAMIVAGCTSPTPTPTPTPVPTATPTPVPTGTPTPSVDRTYQLVEKYAAGIDNYNAGVGYVNTSMNLKNSSDYVNASYYVGLAADKMEAAKADFEGMLWYASNDQQTLLSQKWTETADLFAKSYRNASLGYKEYYNESLRATPNYVKANYYMDIAQQYNDQGAAARQQAGAIGDQITFAVPTKVPVK